MKTTFHSLKLILAAALVVASPFFTVAQTSPPLRSYAISGIENSRDFVATRGWIVSTQTFSGTLELVTTTDARLTKIYADGSSVVRDLILHWVVDLAAPTQGGTAAEVPDPNDPVIKRTTYSLGLQFDGLRYTASGNFQTRAWMSVSPGIYDWFIVAYGDFSGFVVSPIGNYAVAGSEKSGKATSTYTGTFTLLSPLSGKLTKNYTGGATMTVNLALLSAVDLTVPSQTIAATQIENQPSQSTGYALDLQLNGMKYSVNSVYVTTQTKGRKTSTVSTGSFRGAQP